MANNLKFLLVFLLGVLLVLLVVTSLFDFQKVLETLYTVRLDIILLATLVHFSIIGLLAIRMKILSSTHKKIGFIRCVKITFLGLFVNFITPVVKVGGEPVKVIMLRKDTGSSKGWAIVSMDTFVEILSSLLTFIAIFVVFFNVMPLMLMPYFIVFLAITILLILVFLKVSLTYKWIKKIFDVFARAFPKHFKSDEKDYVAIFQKAFRQLLNDKKTMLASMGVSFGTKILEFVRVWLIFYALGISVSPTVILLAWAFLLILYMVPWLPGGLGLVEAGVAFAFISLGVAAPAAASVVLLDRFITFWLVMAIGFVVAYKQTMGLSDIMKNK